MEFKTAEDIRKAVIDYYPDVINDKFSVPHPGFVNDNSTVAIGVVLMSAIVLGTTDPVKLAEFSKYSESLIAYKISTPVLFSGMTLLQTRGRAGS
jgi:hypothetical protein